MDSDHKHASLVHEISIEPGATISEALARMDAAGTGALAVCSPDGTLLGILTDGDIRRAILRGVALEDGCEDVANPNPVVSRKALSQGEALFLMSRRDINHLPVVDENGVLQDFILRRDLGGQDDLELSAQKRLQSVMISPDESITGAIAHLDEAGTGGLALCDADGRLVGLLTDGDLRRAILRGVSLDEPCVDISVRQPMVAHGAIAAQAALDLMTQHEIDHLPVVDDEGRLVDFLLRRDLVLEPREKMSAVIMAGGFGKRLMPLTENVPKPMLPVGGRPLLERTIRQLRRAGIEEVNLTTHYLPERIAQHFGDGREFGVSINYANEDQPLGTAGGLKLVKRPDGPFLVLNGDILTGVSFQDMLDYHRNYSAEMTVGVRKHEISVPFGVVDCEDVQIREVREKPTVTLFINAGVYLLEPTACDYIPENERFDMTDLIRALVQAGRTVVSFPIIEYWQDVGRLEDYQLAQNDVHDERVQ
jgi:dTDP-glucose pyrophosphorylase/CBS domain-containing protein